MGNAPNPNFPSSKLQDCQTQGWSSRNPYDDEELLLLHLADINNDPLPSGQEAAVDEARLPTSLSGGEVASSLLMERPQSSGIDVTAFRFSKPLQCGQKLSSRVSRGRKPGASISQRADFSHQDQNTVNELGHGEEMRAEVSGTHTGLSKQLSTRTKDNFRCADGIISDLQHQGRGQLVETENTENRCLNRGSSPTPIASEDGNSDNPTANPIIQDDDRRSRQSISRDMGPNLDSTAQSACVDRVAPENSSAVRSATPRDNNFRVTKHRSVKSRKRGSNPMPVGPISAHLTEDDLFQLLIGKIKQREENDLAATNHRAKLEADILELRTENQSLKDHVEAFSAQLQRRTLEARRYKAHMDNWRSKLRKFKEILNGLGADYEALHGESGSLKTTGISLEHERKSLIASIDEVKSQVSQVSGKVCDERRHLSEAHEIVNSLQNSVRNAEDKAENARIQLADERKRSAVLESYIQNHSLAQGKQVGSIRSDQLEMMDKMKSGFELIVKQWGFSQSSIQSTLRPMFDECLASIKNLAEKYSVDKKDIQQSTNMVRGLVSQMNLLVLQLTNDIGGNSELNTQLAQDLRRRADMIVNAVDSNSVLFKQLAAGQEMCTRLKMDLESVAPKLCDLTASIGRLDEKEDGLVQKLGEVEKSFFESRVFEKTALELQATEQSTRNQLQLQLDEISAQLDIAQASLAVKEAENEKIRNSLSEAGAKAQDTEEQVMRLQSEVAFLQGNAKAAELRVREELNRASVIARDHIRAKFEQQLHNALREKMETERELDKIKEQLASAQQTLLATEDSSKHQRDEIESLLSAKEAQIKDLQASQEHTVARLATQDVEIKMLKDIESSSFERQKLLEQQLEEANEKILNHGHELSSREEKQYESLRGQEARIESLQANFRTKDEECLSMQNELLAANSAMSKLQTGKEKAKAEIHSLLRRVQESERWMKIIKETFERLGMNTSEEAFPEAWNRLEALLQAKILASSSTAISSGSARGKSPINHGVRPSSNGSTGPTPQRAEVPSEGVFQTTELIYRTQSIQGGASSPPSSQGGFQPWIGGSRMNSIPDSQSTANIVPFSSIQNQLSPANSFGQNEHLNELISLFMSTPENKGLSAGSFGFNAASLPNEVPEKAPQRAGFQEDSSRNPEKQSIQPKYIAEQHADLSDGTKRKAVTFEADAPVVRESSNEVSESPSKNPRTSAHSRIANERVSSRLHQRTYGKSQHLGTSRESRKRSLGAEPPQVEANANSNIRPGSLDVDDKKATVSGASRSRPERKTRRASEYFETRASPTSLASGSSRRSPGNGHSGKKWIGRGQRRGRRSRGERYNARFSQETGAIL